MTALIAQMTIKIHPEMSQEGKEILRQMIREELFIVQQERQMVEMWEAQQEKVGESMEIDYRRWKEFIETTHADTSFDGLSPEQRKGKQRGLQQVYVQWLKQQKPKHLEFEVK